MTFKIGQLICPRGANNNKELFEVVYMNKYYIQAINIKQNSFVSFPRTISNTYRLASDSDIRSFIARYLKYYMIQNYGENGNWKVSDEYVRSL